MSICAFVNLSTCLCCVSHLLFCPFIQDRLLNFRDCYLGTLDVIIIARLITRNKYLWSLDLSKNNLTGPGKSPLNDHKQDFGNAIAVVGEDNEKYGAWNDEQSQSDDSDSDSDSDNEDDNNNNNEENSDNDDDENGNGNGNADTTMLDRETIIRRATKKPPKPTPKDTIEGVDVNLYGVYLIFKNLVCGLCVLQSRMPNSVSLSIVWGSKM